ncbi:hypothetical protein [Nostoc sp.]|uniref:hypothetical protein n=1 Tax=Nostoc sp. TaxID=1180 RepID=UPI002FF72B1E
MIIQVLQLLDSEGRRTGYWRLTARTSEESNSHALCGHLHNSYKEAWDCVDAWKEALKLRGDSL